MDRNREARRTTMAATNGLSRRRHRSSSLRDSPEEDGPIDLQETARLRDRASGKKDRDRDRDRERDRDRDRERDRDRDRLNRTKRRRGDRLMHGNNREDVGDESSEESVNDEEDDDDDDGGGASVRMLPPPNPSVSLSSSSSSMLNHNRKSFPPAKSFRAPPAWKAADEMIGVSVPRKARSASTKRSHEWASGGGIVGEQIHRQASTSPVRPSLSAMAAAASPAPVSPSSSNPLLRKKLKPNGPKLRPPKASSKSSSSAQDEIEIEIAEVLYEMMRQPQGPSKQEILVTDSMKFESREANKSTSDSKSRVSSPISNSPSALPQSSQPLPQNSSSSVTPLSAVAPKRKRPRPVKYEDENPSIFTVQSSPISSATKMLSDQPAETETSSPNLEKNPGSAAENGGVSYDLALSHTVPASSEAQPESIKLEGNHVSDSMLASEKSGQDLEMSKEESKSAKKDSPGRRLDDYHEDMTVTKANLTNSEIDCQREEKFQIDLMAPPPLRSSPERDGENDFTSVDAKPMVIDTETEIKPIVKGDAKALKIGKAETANVETEKAKTTVEESESKKPKERNIDLQLDLEKTDRDSGRVSVSGNKLPLHVPKQQQQHNTEKNAQSSSLPLPMSMAGWPSGLSPMGYVAPLQGVVSMDGSAVSSAAIQPPLFNQPRLKRCATHCNIARNICYHQQIARMNSFWPAAAAAAGSGQLYGPKHCNLNVMPSAELHGSVPGRAVNSAHDKGQGLAIFPGHAVKDKVSQAANIGDAAQRKQILLQQALPPGAPSNILHGPAFIFPLSHQQQQAAAAAASVRPGSVKSPSTAGSAVPSSTPNSTPVSASVTAPTTAPAMSFNYPNMPTETQYLAILQNNTAYPFPIPAPPAYRGPHAQLPFFNGSFYSSQMLHPSQLQQQQQPNHSQQSQQVHQNTSISSGSSSSHKHLQNQQQKSHASGINGGSGSLQGFPASKGQSSQSLQMQQRQQQQQQNQHVPHQARQLESEMGGEDSPSTADSRVSRAGMSIYGQNFAMPIHAPNFALMAPPVSLGGANGAASASGNNGEKKQQQQQQLSSKSGVEASQAFAMSFASINGATTAPALDIASLAQHQAILQSVPDVRQSYHYMAATAAAQAAQHKKNYRVSEEGKTGGDSSGMEEERKPMTGKASAVGQSIAFSRPDLSDTPGSNVIDSSARTLNLGSNQVRTSSSVVPGAIGGVNTPTSQQQLQRNQQQQQQQQMIHLKQHQLAASARTKTPATSNGNVYSDHLPSTSMAAKFPNALSSFPQNLVQSSSSPTQSPQWKNSVRTSTSQVPSPSMALSNSSSLKNLPQQQGRMQQSHTQISFAANPKASTQPQGLQSSSSNQSPSPPIMVGSPTTSMSKSAGGSPRTTTSSTGNKAGQASLSSQQAKNSPNMANLKSSPVGGRNVSSILGNPHITSSSSTGTKPTQMSQQQQQQLSKQSLQQAQLIFSTAYMQAQASHSNNNTSAATPVSGYYNQRRRTDQQPQHSQQAQNSSGTSSSGMLSLCPPVTLANTSTSDPAKAAAVAAVAAANNMKGALPSQALIHPAQFAAAQAGNPHQLVSAGFSYVHAVPTAVQVKPAEQKQPAGE